MVVCSEFRRGSRPMVLIVSRERCFVDCCAAVGQEVLSALPPAVSRGDSLTLSDLMTDKLLDDKERTCSLWARQADPAGKRS